MNRDISAHKSSELSARIFYLVL